MSENLWGFSWGQKLENSLVKELVSLSDSVDSRIDFGLSEHVCY